LTIESIEILLLVAALVAMLTQRVRLPDTIGLVAAGIVLGLLSFVPQIDLSADALLKWLQVLPRASTENINSQEPADRSQQPPS
jgi:Kef-type K+ transport system membrane component KefB